MNKFFWHPLYYETGSVSECYPSSSLFPMLRGAKSHGPAMSSRAELIFLWGRSELGQAFHNRSTRYAILNSLKFILKAMFYSSWNTTEHWFVIDACKLTTFNSQCSMHWTLGRCALIKYWLSPAYLQETI